MGLKAVLSLDLKDADSKQRREFNEEMQNRSWKESDKLTTLWTASFEDGIKPKEAKETAKKEVETAAKAAGIIHWNGVVHVGNTAPDFFND